MGRLIGGEIIVVSLAADREILGINLRWLSILLQLHIVRAIIVLNVRLGGPGCSGDGLIVQIIVIICLALVSLNDLLVVAVSD